MEVNNDFEETLSRDCMAEASSARFGSTAWARGTQITNDGFGSELSLCAYMNSFQRNNRSDVAGPFNKRREQ